MQTVTHRAGLISFFLNQHTDHAVTVFNRFDRLNDPCALLGDRLDLLGRHTQHKRPGNSRFVLRFGQQTVDREFVRRRCVLGFGLGHHDRVTVPCRTVNENIRILPIGQRLEHTRHARDHGDFLIGQIGILLTQRSNLIHAYPPACKMISATRRMDRFLVKLSFRMKS